MAYLYFADYSYSRGTGVNLAYISIKAQLAGSEKACKFELPNGNTFWIPKAAIKLDSQGDLTIAKWFKFDERAFNIVKAFISNFTTN